MKLELEIDDLDIAKSASSMARELLRSDPFVRTVRESVYAALSSDQIRAAVSASVKAHLAELVEDEVSDVLRKEIRSETKKQLRAMMSAGLFSENKP